MLISDPSKLDRHDLDRVNVVGLTGSGKSTFARRLATALNSEFVEMDQLFHGPNWAEPEVHVFRERVKNAIDGDHWVLDGNYHSKKHDLKWQRVTAIVWMDTPFLQNIWQSTTRAIHRGLTQQELWPGTGNREHLATAFFSRKSIILWALINYRRLQKRYRAVRDGSDWHHIPFIQLRSDSCADRLEQAARLLMTR